MSEPLSPHEQENGKGEEPHDYKRPEYVILDDRPGQGRGGESEFSEEGEQSQFKGQKGELPLSLRFCCFLGLVFCSIFGFGMLLLSLVATLLAVVIFFQNREINKTARRFWKLCGNTAVAGFGFTLGLINPRLGLSLVLVYFSLTGESMDSDILRKIFRRSMSDF